MTAVVRIPGVWRGLTAGEAAPLLEGDTVGEVLRNLTERYPDMRDRLFAAGGGLKPYLNVFLNQVDIRSLDELETQVLDGDELLLLMAISGG
ncbi:MAG TPA: MoaD/ThiS family protein [Symbiobacteriaceae bacterium]|jgi:molybdopterin converting factor small subunit